MGRNRLHPFCPVLEIGALLRRHLAARVHRDRAVVAAIRIRLRHHGRRLAVRCRGIRRLARNRRGIGDRLDLPSESVEEVLRHLVLAVRRKLPQPHLLLGVVETVLPRHSRPKRLAALAVARPQLAAAAPRIGL